MQKIKLLKFMDKYIGILAVRCMPRISPERRPETVDSVMFIRPGGIGDAVLLIPTLLAFQERHPGVRLTVLAEKRNSAAFGLCSAVDELLLYDKPWDLLKAVQQKYNVVIDSEQWHRLSALVARVVRAGIRVGFATNDRRGLFTNPIPYHQDDYEVDSFMHLLEPFSYVARTEGGSPFLSIPFHEAETVDHLLAPIDGKQFVVIFPGASVPERRWGAEKFGAVAEWLHAQGIPVVVVGGKEDVYLGERVVAGGFGLNLAGKTSLCETAAVINRSILLVSGDSGILHIGAGLGKPTISLFGPGRAKKWAPRGGRHIVINKCLPCSPCTTFGYTPKCPIHAKCIAEISVDEVVEAVDNLMINNGLEHHGQHKYGIANKSLDNLDVNC